MGTLRALALGVSVFVITSLGGAREVRAQHTVSITKIHGANLNESEDSGSDEITVWVNGSQIKGAERGLTDGDNDYVRIGGSHPRERRVNVILFENQPNGHSVIVEIREQQGTFQRDGRIGKFRVGIQNGQLQITPDTSARVEGRTVFLNGDDTDYRITVNFSD